MLLVKAAGLSKTYGDRCVFSNVCFEIHSGDRVALFGPNGCGKSTIIKMIVAASGDGEAGMTPAGGGIKPDTGGLWVDPHVSIGYLEQTWDLPYGITPIDACLEAVADTGTGSAQHAKQARSMAVQTLQRFGIGPEYGRSSIASLSSGERMRVGLARAWCANPDLIILDEPTNHLDIPGIQLLTGMIASFGGTVLLVSHDRYFLDQTASRIVELTATGARSYPGNYTAYCRQKRVELDTESRIYQRHEQEQRRIEKAMALKREWAEKAHKQAGQNDFLRARAKKSAARAKAILSRLEKMHEEKVAKPTTEHRIYIRLGDTGRTGRRLIHAEGLSKAYLGMLFQDGYVSVMRGDRVGIVGPNGSGKTTLLKLLLGVEPPTSGSVWMSPSARWFYFDQDLMTLDPSANVFDTVSRSTGKPPQEVTDILATLLLRGDDTRKRIEVLSSGERARVAFAGMLGAEYDIIALDEPTNNLDIQSREAIEGALQSWDGTLIVVSHDRYLLDRLCNKIIAIEDGALRTYPGTYSEYERRRCKGPEKSLEAGDILVLENRLSVLSSLLGNKLITEDERMAAEREFIDVSHRLAAQRARARATGRIDRSQQ